MKDVTVRVVLVRLLTIEMIVAAVMVVAAGPALQARRMRPGGLKEQSFLHEELTEAANEAEAGTDEDELNEGKNGEAEPDGEVIVLDEFIDTRLEIDAGTDDWRDDEVDRPDSGRDDDRCDSA